MQKFFFVVIVAVLWAASSDGMHAKLKALKCFCQAPHLGHIEMCYVKAISRKISSFNVIATLNGSFSSPILLTVVVYYRYGTIFRQVIKPPTFEWCSAVDNLSSNVYLKAAYDVLKDIAPQAFQHCPWSGRLEFTNITFDSTKYPAPFPQGTYKTTLNVSLSEGQVAWGYMISEVVSELKHSF